MTTKKPSPIYPPHYYPPLLISVEDEEKLKTLYRQVKEIAEGKHINIILPRSKD